MKKTLAKYLLLLFFIVPKNSVQAQNISLDDLIKTFDTVRSINLTSLKTEILSEVLQVGVENGIISSDETGLKLKTTIFGLKKIFNPAIVIDRNYALETFSRNFEIGGGLQLNQASKVNGFNLALKYALINRRDVSIIDNNHLNSSLQQLNNDILVKTENAVNDLNTAIAIPLNNALNINKTLLPTDPILNKLLAFKGVVNDDVYNDMKQTLLAYNAAGKISIDTNIFLLYPQKKLMLDSLAQQLENGIKKRSLLTWAVNSNYQDKRWDSISSGFEYLKGLGFSNDEQKPWDLYASVFYNAKTDTLQKKSLTRQVIIARLGLNKVLAKKANGSSFLEIIGAAEYDNILKGLYSDEKRNNIMADFTITIRITNSLFIPLEFKYDPANKNLFGFLNFKWDLLRTSLNNH